MNLVGEGVPYFVLNQIDARQEMYGSGYLSSRSPEMLVYLNANTSWCKLVSGADVNNSNELAKEYVLFNGTTPNGIGINYNNNAYNIAKNEQGFKPMPGIISANINHENRGSLKRAEVKIKCFNIEQFKILDLLYLRLGYTILLEWGHSMYYIKGFNEEGKFVKSVNGFGSSLSEIFLKGEIDYDDFLKYILSQRVSTHGNYDAMLARVENFSWTFNKDGSYDITLKLISIGDIIESLKVNVSLPSPGTPLDTNNTNQSNASIIRNYAYSNSLGAWLALGVPSIDQETLTEEAKKIQDPTYSRTVLPPATTMGITLQPKPSPSTKPITTLGTGSKLPFDLIDPNTGKLINSQTNLPYENQLESPNFLHSNPIFTTINFKSDIGTQYYVRLGELLQFIQAGSGDKSSIIPKVFIKGKNTGVPLIKFDLNEDNNLIYTDPAQISNDPTVCFIKKRLLLNSKEYSYADDNNQMLEFETEIDGIKYGKLMNIYVNSICIVNTLNDNITILGELDLYTFLNKLIKKIAVALGSINDLEIIIDETLNLIKIIDRNPLPNKDKLLEKFDRPIQPATFLLYGYEGNQNSFVRDFNFKSEIVPGLASTIVVASQREGIVVGIDGSGFNNLKDKDLSDRFKEKITNDLSIDEQLKQKQQGIDIVNERWGMYKNFLISLSTDSKSGYKTDNCATKSNCSNNQNTLKELIRLNANVSNIIELNRPSTSPTSGFIPLNLSLTINGMSGMKMYQKFIIDTRYLPKNYPESAEFLIKNIKHEIADNQWVTKLESFAITKEVSSYQKDSQEYLNNSAAVSNYNPKINLIVNNANPITNNEKTLNFPTVDQNIPNVAQNPLDPNDTTSLVVKGTTRDIWNPYNLKNYPSREVRQIIIHYTDYNNTPVGVVESLASAKKFNFGPKEGRFGIHYSIGRDGYVAKGVPEGQASIHGNRWNYHGIGIEMVNLGYKPGGVQDPVSLPYGFGYPSPNTKIYQEYTDAQINALENLIKEISNRWPKIKEGIPLYSKLPKNVWNGGFWKMVVGPSRIPATKRPPDNSWINLSPNESNWLNPGIWPHAGGGGSKPHSDPAPTPKLLSLLQKFGYSID